MPNSIKLVECTRIKSSLQSVLWTAHGVKILPSRVSLRWIYTPDGSRTIPAFPHLEQLLAAPSHASLLASLRSIPDRQYDTSIVVTRDVRRIPLKLDFQTALDEKEANHLKASFDGLSHFYPVDIYPENIVSHEGLLTAFRRLQLLEGFGLEDHHRFGSYSLLHVDVKIYWDLLRFLYSYTGMAPIRHDLFLVFGYWHAYSYAHIALWKEFRSTFLADAFWAIFPEQKLLRRPPLVQSSTFFTWIRLAYPTFREPLQESVVVARRDMIDYDIKLVQQLERGILMAKNNPYRPIVIRLENLQTLMEFAIPVIQDYGVALKGNDYPTLDHCLHGLVAFFVMCSAHGTLDYRRSLYCFLIINRYWSYHHLPIMQLLQANHTLFSEESGEIALSVLATSQPTSNRAKYEQVRKDWQLVRARSDLHGSADESFNLKKKRRMLSILFFIFLYYQGT